MRDSLPRRLLCSALLLALTLSGVAARAETDIQKAARLFKEGRAAMNAGDAAAACPKFAEAQRLDPAAGTLLNLALCDEAIGKLASAFEHLKTVMTLLSPNDPRVKLVAEKIDSIAPKIPRLRLSTAPGAPEEMEIDRDGQGPVPIKKLGGQIFLDPGDHVLVVSAPQRAPKRYTVTLGPNEVRSLAIEPGPAPEAPRVAPLAPSAPAAPPVAPASPVQARLGAVSIGLGGALLVMGAVAGGLAIADKSTVQNDCHGTSVCDSQAGVDAARRGRAVAIASTVGFIGGVALAGTGIALVVTSRRAGTPASALVPHPGGLAWQGAF